MTWTRRTLLRIGALGLGVAASGCERAPVARARAASLDLGNWITYRAQRLLIPADRLAPEFPRSAISADFRANGTVDPPDADYKSQAARRFADWRLAVTGLVRNPLSLSLDEIRALPRRTQITRHDCVEGWSCIGEWTGAPLSEILERAGVESAARYIVCYCADTMDTNALDSADADNRYYTSHDLVDARHPQTIVAYEMNGAALDVPHGAPLRLRVERQLGYKMPKYLRRIDLVADFGQIRGGRGGYWEDLGYDWFAGV